MDGIKTLLIFFSEHKLCPFDQQFLHIWDAGIINCSRHVYTI